MQGAQMRGRGGRRSDDWDRWWRAGTVVTREDRPTAREDRLWPRRQPGGGQGWAVLRARVNWRQRRPASSLSAGGPPLSVGGSAVVTGILSSEQGCGHHPTPIVGKWSSSTSVEGGVQVWWAMVGSGVPAWWAVACRRGAWWHMVAMKNEMSGSGGRARAG
jgi:hypothetical protein